MEANFTREVIPKPLVEELGASIRGYVYLPNDPKYDF